MTVKSGLFVGTNPDDEKPFGLSRLETPHVNDSASEVPFTAKGPKEQGWTAMPTITNAPGGGADGDAGVDWEG